MRARIDARLAPGGDEFSKTARFTASALSLVSEDEVQEEIAVGNTTRRLREATGDQFYAINNRLAVVMGLHAGFLTAASALGKKFPDDGPHLIYLPERTFVIDKFLADVKATQERHGRCVVAVSEGIHDASGQPILAQLAKQVEHDAHGNVQLSGSGALADLLCEEIKAKLGLKRVRGDTFGYLQRSFIGCVSDVDAREAREVGEKAVQYAMWGQHDGSVTIKRTGYYSADYELAPLTEVAGKTRVMDDAFIADNGTDITDAFRLYLRPLLGSDMPDAYRLRPAPVAKVLNLKR